MSNVKKYIKALQLKEHSFKILPSNYFEHPYSSIVEECRKQYERSKSIDLDLINIPEAKECQKENVKSDSFGEYEYSVKFEYAKRIRNNFCLPEDPQEVPSAVLSLSNSITSIIEGESKTKTLYDIVNDSLNEFYERKQNFESGSQYDMSWGYRLIDEITYGLRPKLIYVAARPSMGKSLILGEVAKNVAKQGKNVVFFTAEMSASDVVGRLIYSEAGIEGVYYNSGSATQYHVNMIESVVDKVANLPLIIDDKPSMTPEYIRNRVLQLKNEGKCDVVFIDYLQKLNMYHLGNSENDYLTKTSNIFQNLMKEASIPIIIASQLNRSVEQRPLKVPMLSDLRGSGSIEQDADIIAFLYRPNYYGITEDENGENVRDVIEFIIPKNRGGRLGNVKLYHDNMSRVASTRFEQPTSEPFNPSEGMPKNAAIEFEEKTPDDVPF